MDKTINILKNNIINVDNKLSTVSKNKLLINKKPYNKNNKDSKILTKKLDIKDDNDNKNKNELVNTINLDYINNRIDKEICDNTINKLKDTYLINEYKACKSVKNKIKKLELILEKYNIETDITELIINDYILDLIPAGTKGVIRGNKFKIK